jgi:hypothetical protein
MSQHEDLEIDQGADVAIQLEVVNKNGSIKDLTNHIVAAKMKKTYNSDSADTTTFTSSITDASGGVIVLALTNTQTNSLNAGRYVYDVEISFVDSASNTIVERILEGNIQVTPSVTR